MRSYDTNKIVEEAIRFLVYSLDKTGHNPKPVILHSIRTAMYLDQQGYDYEVVIGALLHDLVEDSKVTLEEIETKFGLRVKQLVRANSFDKNISDKRRQYEESFKRCTKAGKEALLIKASDLWDNSFYYQLTSDRQSFSLLMDKLEYFLKVSRALIGQGKVWQELTSRFTYLRKQLDA